MLLCSSGYKLFPKMNHRPSNDWCFGCSFYNFPFCHKVAVSGHPQFTETMRLFFLQVSLASWHKKTETKVPLDQPNTLLFEKRTLINHLKNTETCQSSRSLSGLVMFHGWTESVGLHTSCGLFKLTQVPDGWGLRQYNKGGESLFSPK